VLYRYLLVSSILLGYTVMIDSLVICINLYLTITCVDSCEPVSQWNEEFLKEVNNGPRMMRRLMCDCAY
jgi:hypothetical protein